MTIYLPGSLQITTLDRAENYVERAIQTLMFALREDDVGKLTRTENTIRYTRGYNLLPGANSRLMTFDPGEISVTAFDHMMGIRFRLGLTPLYFPAGFSLICMPLLYLYGHDAKLVAELAALLMLFIITGIFVGVYRVRRWLKLIVGGVVDKHSFSENTVT